MIELDTALLKYTLTKISKGVEKNGINRNDELLEMTIEDKKLVLFISNNQYSLNIEIPNVTEVETDFHVTIDADTFIKLVTKTTSKTIKLSLEDKKLNFIGDGNYSFPLEVDLNGNMRILQRIKVVPQESFEINGDILDSIYTFGNLELSNSTPIDEVQRYFYLDNKGAITYMDSPYINNFELVKAFKLLIPQRVAQLFSLFKLSKATVGIARDIEGNLYQNKLIIESQGESKITLCAYCPSDSLVDRYPAEACRNLQENPYPGKVVVSKSAIMSALTRLNIFNTSHLSTFESQLGRLYFKREGIEIETKNNNKEYIAYTSVSNYIEYNCLMNLEQLLKHIKATTGDEVNINYGNSLCIMLSKDRFNQIIAEMEDDN